MHDATKQCTVPAASHMPGLECDDYLVAAAQVPCVPQMCNFACTNVQVVQLQAAAAVQRMLTIRHLPI